MSVLKGIDIEEMDCDTCFKMQEILREEIDDPEFLNFAIENYSEMFGYINTGRINIRIHRLIEGKMWFGREVFVNSIIKIGGRGVFSL